MPEEQNAVPERFARLKLGLFGNRATSRDALNAHMSHAPWFGDASPAASPSTQEASPLTSQKPSIIRHSRSKHLSGAMPMGSLHHLNRGDHSSGGKFSKRVHTVAIDASHIPSEDPFPVEPRRHLTDFDVSLFMDESQPGSLPSVTLDREPASMPVLRLAGNKSTSSSQSGHTQLEAAYPFASRGRLNTAARSVPPGDMSTGEIASSSIPISGPQIGQSRLSGSPSDISNSSERLSSRQSSPKSGCGGVQTVGRMQCHVGPCADLRNVQKSNSSQRGSTHKPLPSLCPNGNTLRNASSEKEDNQVLDSERLAHREDLLRNLGGCTSNSLGSNASYSHVEQLEDGDSISGESRMALRKLRRTPEKLESNHSSRKDYMLHSEEMKNSVLTNSESTCASPAEIPGREVLTQQDLRTSSAKRDFSAQALSLPKEQKHAVPQKEYESAQVESNWNAQNPTTPSRISLDKISSALVESREEQINGSEIGNSPDPSSSAVQRFFTDFKGWGARRPENQFVDGGMESHAGLGTETAEKKNHGKRHAKKRVPGWKFLKKGSALLSKISRVKHKSGDQGKRNLGNFDDPLEETRAGDRNPKVIVPPSRDEIAPIPARKTERDMHHAFEASDISHRTSIVNGGSRSRHGNKVSDPAPADDSGVGWKQEEDGQMQSQYSRATSNFSWESLGVEEELKDTPENSCEEASKSRRFNTDIKYAEDGSEALKRFNTDTHAKKQYLVQGGHRTARKTSGIRTWLKR